MRLTILALVAVVLAASRSAIAQSVKPAFEVATIKPAPHADPTTGSWSLPSIGRFTASHVSLTRLIQLAYNVDSSQIANKPGWLDEDLYDVEAKPEPGVKLSREELRPRLQSLLHDRFHLVLHQETRLEHGYALSIAKSGPHLTPTKAEHFPGWRTNVSSGQMRGINWTMPQTAKYLTEAAGFPVIDETGLSGSYDIDFAYNANPDQESSLPPLSGALKAATGLVLLPKKIPVATIVIDSVDKAPTEN